MKKLWNISIFHINTPLSLFYEKPDLNYSVGLSTFNVYFLKIRVLMTVIQFKTVNHEKKNIYNSDRYVIDGD